MSNQRKPYHNVIEHIIKFAEGAGQEPDMDNARLYVAFILEEVAEMLNTLGFTIISQNLDHISNSMKQNESGLDGVNFEALLDDGFDIAWTALELMHMISDIRGSFEHGAVNNLSKFDPDTGKAIKDENGKVIKHKDWRHPQFKQFLRDQFQ